ncbi:MAG: molybdenum cofactor guanylyltransferase [Bacillota bacterium]
MQLDATGIILSGGRNTRMRSNKAFLEIGKGKIIEETLKKLQPLFAQVIIVTNEPELYSNLSTQLVRDLIHGFGPLSGIHAGITASNHNLNFVMACDLPFIEPDLVRFMIEHAGGYDVVVPQVGNYLQPLHAVYAKSCITPITGCLQEGIAKVVAFYHQVKVNYIGESQIKRYGDPQKMFFNVNTPDELQVALDMSSRENGSELVQQS